MTDDSTSSAGKRLGLLNMAVIAACCVGCAALFLPACEDAQSLSGSSDNGGPYATIVDFEIANPADIRDASGNPPPRPTLPPRQILQQDDADQLLAFLYWQRDPDYRIDDDLTLLTWAAQLGRDELVRILLKYGADLHAPVRVNNTALHWAVRRDQLETVETLLQHGADPNALGGPDRDMSPLSLARNRRNDEMTQLLQKYGAKQSDHTTQPSSVGR